jgi:hypothetical protein
MKKKNWIAGAVKNKGSLHRDLHVAMGHNIPLKKITKAAKGSGKTAKRARLAMTLRKLRK